MGLALGSLPLTGGHGTSAAFAPLLEDKGVTAASTVAMAAATYGLVMGNIIGNPIAIRRIKALKLKSSDVSRKKPGAMVTDREEAISRVLQMVKEGTVTAITGKVIPVKADSICIHGDSPAALEFSRSIREALTEAGIELHSLD